MADEQTSQRWWQTVPGILTATAGAITAVTGLIVALHQTGFFEASPEATPSTGTTGGVASSATPTTVGQPMQYPITLASGTKVRLGGATYQILTAQLDWYDADRRVLRFTVRLTNNEEYPVNFWDDTFRLLVEGVPRSPVGGLNKLVQGHSAEEGEVEFMVPAATRSVDLLVRNSDESSRIPVDFSVKRK